MAHNRFIAVTALHGTVNGVLKGQVEPGMTQVFTIEHRRNPSIIKAYGNRDIDVWGHGPSGGASRSIPGTSMAERASVS